MKRIQRHKAQQVWFARWRKTPWAVFRSLGMVVHIQNMAVSSFKDSLLQQPGSSKQDALRLFRLDELLDFLLDCEDAEVVELATQALFIQNLNNKNSEVAPAGELTSSNVFVPVNVVVPYPFAGTFFMPIHER